MLSRYVNALVMTAALAVLAARALAAEVDTGPPLELTAAGDKVELRAEPTAEGGIIKVLPGGTHLEALEPFDDAAEGRAERWVHVRAGDATGWVGYVNVIPAPLYDYLARVDKLWVLSERVNDGTPGWAPHEDVVCAGALELRAEPAADAKVTAVLKSGDAAAVDVFLGDDRIYAQRPSLGR